MKWEEEVNGKWEERDIVNAYSIAMKKSENGEKLTEDDILKIQNYRKLNPHRPLSKNTVEALNEERYNWTDIPETVFSKITDPSEWSWGTLGQALEGLNDIAIKQGKNLGRVYGAKLQPRDALGRFIKDAIKPRSWLSAKFKGMSNNTSKIIGRGAKVLGFGISAVLEGVDYYSKYKNVGRAVSYGAVGGFVALGAGVVAGAIGTTLALPAVGTLALGVAVGAVASVGLKAAYENIKPVRAVIDGAPVGKLMVCTEEPQSTTPPTLIESPCVREAVDESIVTAKWDSNFRMVYAMLALLSSVIWCLVSATRANIFKDAKPPTR